KDDDIASHLVRNAGVFRYLHRSLWIMKILAEGRFSAEAFQRFDHRRMDWRAAITKGQKLADYPPAALYWMWRTYTFGETDRLGQRLKLAESSHSLGVRDAGRLVTELRRGRRAVGNVRDVSIVCEVAKETSGFKPW